MNELMNSTVGAGLLIGGALLVVWFVVPRRDDAVPRHLAIILAALTFSTLAPGPIFIPIQGAALLAAFLEWFRVPAPERRGKAVVCWATAIFVFWTVLVFHPNIPSLNVGLLGYRKSVLGFAGIVLGCTIRQKYLAATERLVVQLLVVAVGVSVVSHYYFPQLTASVSRDADKYTALYGGEERLQGIFAGPFHMAQAGLLLIAWALVRWHGHRRLAALALVLGAVGTYLSLVRSAYIALALIVVAVVLVGPVASVRVRRAAYALVGAIVAWGVLASGSEFAETATSISGASSDGRLLNRLPEYQHGIEMVTTSPIFGWGAGSAGDTLGKYFAFGQHVTAHNIVLKFAVEGGLLGVLLVGGLAVAVIRRLHRSDPQAQLALVIGVALLGMGITGNAVEAMPLSYLALLLVGLGVTEKERPIMPTEPANERLEHVRSV